MRCYAVPLAGRTLTLLGPDDPDAVLDDPRTEARYYAEDEHMPYWACPWAASLMLARFIAEQPGGDGRRALEIGCGLGLAGLAAAACGWRVTLTDYEEDALAFAQAAADLNGLGDRVTVERRDWRSLGCGADEADVAVEPGAGIDLLLAADVLFEQRWVEPVASYVAAAGAARTLIADPNRRTADGAEAALRSRGLTVARHAAECVDFDGQIVRGTIYEARAVQVGMSGE